MTSASQWKRCFTNPDSGTKWNIFSALFLGPELSESLQPHIQGHPTPHLSVTHREREKQWFSCKNVVPFWVWLCSHPPDRGQGLLRGHPQGLHQLLLVPWESSLSLALKGSDKSSKSGREVGDSSTERQSGSHSTSSLGELPLGGRSFFPMQEFWNNLTLQARTDPAHL